MMVPQGLRGKYMYFILWSNSVQKIKNLTFMDKTFVVGIPAMFTIPYEKIFP